MPNYEHRIKTYSDISNKLSYMSNNDIAKLLHTETSSKGWGKTNIITINKTKIFVKSIPITDKEYDNMFDTSNLFNLPVFYNYGVKSAGINCYRELLMHIKTTNWVINGEIENFKLMYHYRIMEKSPTEIIDYDTSKKNIMRWNNNQNIKKYLIAKSKASFEIVLFLEYIPYVLYNWLTYDIDKINMYITQMKLIVSFLQNNNIIHFDGGIHNIVTDGKTIYLTDFGLVLDMDFKLNKQEKTFFKVNSMYDLAFMYDHIKFPLLKEMYLNKDYYNKKYGFDKISGEKEYYDILWNNLDEICKHLKYDKKYIKLIKKYWKLSIIMTIFLYSMRHNNKKNNIFPNKLVLQLSRPIN